MLTRIAVNRRIWFTGECRLDRSLRRLGNELVLLSQMHQQRRIKSVDLVEIFLSVTTVIYDRRIDTIARGRQESHRSAEAIAKDGNPADTLRQLGHDISGVLNVLGAGVSIIGLIEAKAVLPVGLVGDR